MTGVGNELSQIIQSLIGIGNNLSSREDLYADIDVQPKRAHPGDSVVLLVSRPAAVSIARQLLQLANSGVEGSHFHIDRASIALDTDHELIVSLSLKPDSPSPIRGQAPE